MLGQEQDTQLVERGADGRYLLEDLVAGSISLDHPLNPAHLARDSLEASFGVGLKLGLHAWSIAVTSALDGIPSGASWLTPESTR